MSDNTYIKARNLAVRVANNWGWLLVMPEQLEKDVLDALDEVWGIVKYPYKGYELLWSAALMQERREEVLSQANARVEVEREREARYPKSAEVIQVCSER